MENKIERIYDKEHPKPLTPILEINMDEEETFLQKLKSILKRFFS